MNKQKIILKPPKRTLGAQGVQKNPSFLPFIELNTIEREAACEAGVKVVAGLMYIGSSVVNSKAFWSHW